MSEPRERELRFEFFGEEPFLRARGALAFGKLVGAEFLENHYFDTADGTLVNRRVMLRVRRRAQDLLDPGGEFVLGLKIGSEPRPGYFDSLEVEEIIAPETALRLLKSPEELYRLDAAPARAFRERFETLRLESIGCLRTERLTKEVGGRRFEFDRVRFPDGSCGFELEIETGEPERVEAWLRDVLSDLGVAVQPQRLTKLEQFTRWKRSRPDADRERRET